ncbi:hypothetical protein PRIPAC_89771 [Pristionchus pacificus]|uniref:Uncharacterized protein n=1 Tax=Pristionchus pacificus TaxID=54126 RepID=A0A2A6B957_PRIPA|nr:hypothetical protein PRIPAC_89771 [Pristionchus pacificus]|eukprot:PDM62397.1 hypothetical protein PRIPAC_51839 [Pristionchus pacificus]
MFRWPHAKIITDELKIRRTQLDYLIYSIEKFHPGVTMEFVMEMLQIDPTNLPLRNRMSEIIEVVHISYMTRAADLTSILTMESRLLDRRVKKLTQRVGKSSESEGAKGLIQVPIDPLLNTDSTNKNHMGDRIPVHLVHGRAPPSPTTAAAIGPTAVAPAALSSGPQSGPQSEEPLSARTPAKEPATNEEKTEISGYATQTASDYVNVSPEGSRPKLPDMTDLPSISTIEQVSDIDTSTIPCDVSSLLIAGDVSDHDLCRNGQCESEIKDQRSPMVDL